MLKFRPDPYIVGILAAVALAAVLPVSGAAIAPFSLFTKFVIAGLFFLYGARLAREAVIAGMLHWRLHLLVLAVTFVAFPLVGVGIGKLFAGAFASTLMLTGVLYLTCLPSTIQSSVAFVANACGAVATAVCTASASQMVGVFITPLLVGLLLRTQGVHVPLSAVEGILLQVLAPFVVGQVVHPWLGAWAARNKGLLSLFDRGVIVLMVYGAFSAAVVAGVWRQITWRDLALTTVIAGALLAIALFGLTRLARRFGFPVEDEIVIAFCGSQKGLTIGIALAGLLFPPAEAGLIVVPVMIYHQLQLISCAALAGRYAKRPAS
ncbi:MAG: bile acid:sodium symporter [Caulobacteraceae bacterium]|nr:bile acid:sodium symporter [Caulobacteraceae bacterium]